MKPQDAMSELLRKVVGFDADATGDRAFEHAVRAGMRRAGVEDPGCYLDLLRGSPDELQQLTEGLVVPETWFFRDHEPFVFLAQHVRDVWLKQHPGQVLRVLSAPCSTGEEPYSIAITLLEAGFDAASFTVDAVDISVHALDAARAGLYGRNSFREKTAPGRDKYFTAEGQRFRVRGEVSSRVSFRQANLTSPSFLAGEAPYHAIFCRNVFIYLVAQARLDALNHLNHLLAPDGLLFTGHSELIFFLQNGYESVRHRRAFACRKAGPAQPAPVLPAFEPPRLKTAPPRRRPAEVRLPPKLVPVAGPATESLLALAQRLADQGAMEEASQLCDRALGENGEDAGAYCLHGLIHEACGRLEEAEECFRRALYLEPGQEDSLLHMTLLLERKGEVARAAILRARLGRLAVAQGGNDA
jgi:chemotaxis protein methyltransferase WspC